MEFSSALTRRAHLPVIDGAQLRVAHLDNSTGFAGARAFPPERWRTLETYSPNVIAGSVAQINRLLERINLRTANIGLVDHSIFVVTQLGDTPLNARLRDLLWHQFGVPIYEVYVDEGSRLLAFECEAQEGWHIAKGVRFSVAYGELLLERSDQVVRTGLSRIIEETACPCGRPELRLIDADQSVAQPAFALSA